MRADPGGTIPQSVAIISSTFPYPVDSGKRVVLSGLVEHFLDRVGAKALHYVLVSGAPPVEPVAFPVHHVPGAPAVEQLVNLGWHAVLRRDRSIQECVLSGRVLRQRLRAVLRDLDVDLEVWDTVRMAQHQPACGSPRARGVVYLDDLFSVRYARMLEAMRERPDEELNVLGEFGQHLPGPLRSLAKHQGVQRAVLELERRLVARSEDRTARQAPLSLLINDVEAAHLRSRAGVTSVEVLPPLLRNVPEQRVGRRYDGRPEFVFLGLLTLPHNASAVRSFLRHQWPEVLRLRPDAHLRVVGRGADRELVDQAHRSGPSVSVEGFVPDLDDLLAGACALLSPLLFGSGVKLKVLDALARGLPVVSTTTGVEGIVSRPDQGCIVEDDLDRWPELLLGLLDPEANRAVSRAGLRHYGGTFSPPAVHGRYDQVFDTAVRGGP